MDYKFDTRGMLVRSDGAVIPADEKNRDYREYLEWVAAGNTAVVETNPKEQQITRQIETSALNNLRAELKLAELQGNGAAQNKLRREISRIKYWSKGV